MKAVTVNGRQYNTPRPGRPVVAVCIDGCEPAYFEDLLARGKLPNLARFRDQGFYGTALGVMPSFTNPNNLSIVNGASPAVHGICGNFFLDPDSGEEVMMNEPRFLRTESLLAALSKNGSRVAVVTAKDKLRRLLGHGVQSGVCFSAEKAHEANAAEHGIDDVTSWMGKGSPDVYSAELSTYVMEAGVRLLREGMPESGPHLMYLSTTDYIQHKHAPGDPVSDAFYVDMDRLWGELADLGAVVGLTADHGMNAKNTPAGEPRVIHLGTLLDEWLGVGKARVILPITDPYVAHHGALGSYATVYLESDVSTDSLLARLRDLPGIELALERNEACERFELPPERLGDLVLIGDHETALGKTPEAHDMTQLSGGLRSHGGLAEQRVPFVISAPLTASYRESTGEHLRNFDIFDALLNGVE